MGKLVNGQWETGSVVSSDSTGAYARIPRTFRDTIDAQHPKFKPESDRYHLYISYACPWAHRTLIYRALKGLTAHISLSVVHPDMLAMGWHFDKNFAGATGDTLFNLDYLHQLYQKVQPDITTSVTVPILFDKHTQQIVNNESADIIRLFNSAFNDLTGNHDDYYPADLQADIDALNDKIYAAVNNGVYRVGFAKTQTAYDEAIESLFMVLDELDARLSDNRFLLGDRITEADLRLIPTLLRFDMVYYIHFKCSVRKIAEYPHLSRYMRDLYQMDAIKRTTFPEHIRRHYYYSHESINPYRIVPKVSFLEE